MGVDAQQQCGWCHDFRGVTELLQETVELQLPPYKLVNRFLGVILTVILFRRTVEEVAPT